jgi:hypothetical protein
MHRIGTGDRFYNEMSAPRELLCRSTSMRNTVIGLILLFIGIALVLLAAICPCLNLFGTALVFLLGTIVMFTALALIAGWRLLDKIIDKALQVFGTIRGWVVPRRAASRNRDRRGAAH